MDNELLKQIIALELKLLEPEVRCSQEQLNLYIHDEFIEFGRSGKVYSKQTVLDDLPLETDQDIHFKAHDFQGRMLAENVVQLTFKGESIVDGVTHHSLRTSIWKQQQARWQMIFHQGTPC